MDIELTPQQIEKLTTVYKKHKHDFLIKPRRQAFLADVSDFIQGAISYPEGWWAANYQFLALTGALGTHEKGNAKLRQAILQGILAEAINNKQLTYYIIKEVIGYKVEHHSMQIAGRTVGSYLTNKILLSPLFTKLKILFKPNVSKPISFGISALQLAYVSYGTAMLAIAKGFRTISPIISGIVTGDINTINFYPDPTKKPNYSDQQLSQLSSKYKLGWELIIYVDKINKDS